ncbi:Phage tail fiber [Salmonella enterica]|nr:phage tail protein [Salmonella enterica subsp. enterica serovar Carrau]SUE83531.1 Phage tail fiber [Salmonella enterica]
MHRIDTPTAQKDKFGQGKNGFTNGDPATGRRATDLNSDMWDAVQEEVCTVIEAAGIQLSKGEHTQLHAAIGRLIDEQVKTRLEKNQNGADIPNKPLFLQNVGLEETINLAKNAVPVTRRINSKPLTGDITLWASDVGALPIAGGRLNGALGIGADNALGGNSIVLGDNDTGFKQDGDGVLGIYANNTRIGYIDNSGLHMSVNVLTNGGIRVGDGKQLSLTSNNNSTMTATFNLWGGADRPTVIELDDDQGWQFYSQRNTDGSISFRVNGQMEPNSYSNFDSRYVQDIRLGSLQYGQVWNGPGFSDTSGYVITGITNGNSDELVDGAQRRPIQKLIGNQWYNVVSI